MASLDEEDNSNKTQGISFLNYCYFLKTYLYTWILADEETHTQLFVLHL